MEIYDIVVVGGGISGLSLCWNLLQRDPKIKLLLVDKGTRPGGCVRTMERSGYRVELGPNGVVDRAPDTLDLIRALGLESELVKADDSARKRYLYMKGELRPLPDAPAQIFKTETLTLAGRLRLLCEPFIPRVRKGREESIAEFAKRRFGRQVADNFLDPFVGGVYAGDPGKISVQAAFPRIYEWEAKYGSVLRGAAKQKKEKQRVGGDTDSIGGLWSLNGGMGVLTRKLCEVLGPERVIQGAAVTELEPFGPGWRLHLGGKHAALLTRQVVLSTPAHVSGDLLSFHCSAAGDILKDWPYAGIVVVALGFKRSQVSHPLDGFGYLVPFKEERPILGCLFSSSIYPKGRSPEEYVLLRVMMGGARSSSLVDLDADSLMHIAEEEVREVLGISGRATLRRAIRWANALPQYTLGHKHRLEQLEQLVTEFCPGISLHSNAFHGVAVNDCTRSSKALAAKLLASSR